MKLKKTIGAVGMLVGLSFSSHATILAPGGVSLDPSQAPGPAPLNTLISAYSFGSLNGTVTSWVTKDPANPLGGLSFYYQVNNIGPEEVSEITTSNFGVTPGAPVEASTIVTAYDGSLPGGVVPMTASRSTGAGSVVGFDFLGSGEIEGGEHSVILVINTSYQSYAVSPGSVIDDNSFNISVLGPALVPEASTLIAGCLLLIPLGASMLRIVRKNQI